MKTGFRGTFVISWSQTKIDGLDDAPVPALSVGAAWAWSGEAVRVDGPRGVLRLEDAEGEAGLRQSAARMVRRLVGAAITGTPDPEEVEVEHPLSDSSFVVTDGLRSYTVTLIETGTGGAPLLMFLDDLPPRGRDLWVVHHSLDMAMGRAVHRGETGVICFVPGTRIDTPEGPRLIEHLREGDLVQTKDNGPQEIVWKGSRRMGGARLHAMPGLRPVRIRAGAFGIERPDEELLVSPDHRLLVQGPVARALFNTPEVLVAARDLVNGGTIRVDLALPEVTYVHLLLPDHQVIWANGVETESFHPANTTLAALGEGDRARLIERVPDLQYDPHLYGGYARRNLSRSEAAILLHDAA